MCASSVKFNVGQSSTVDVAQSSTTTIIHDSFNRKLEEEFEQFVSEEEEFEISPTQVATRTQSVDVMNLTKMKEDTEITYKELIDLSKVIDVEVTSIHNVEDLEGWEVVDLPAL